MDKRRYFDGWLATAALLLLLLAGCCRESRLAPLPEGQQAVRLYVLEGSGGTALALVPVYINGEGPFAFALDTGASHTLVDLDVARKLNLPKAGRPTQITGVTGFSEAIPVRIEHWHIGDVELPPWRAVTLKMPNSGRDVKLAGLFGSDILSRYGTIQIDYAGQVLILNPKAGDQKLGTEHEEKPNDS
jgi:predicted aspartyl protease